MRRLFTCGASWRSRRSGSSLGLSLRRAARAPTMTHAAASRSRSSREGVLHSSPGYCFPVGSTVTFKVVNKGKISHNFAIAGKRTRMLRPGQSTTLTVKFAKKGQVAYVCTLTGHAGAGMKGKFAVGVTPVKTTTTTTTQTTTTGEPRRVDRAGRQRPNDRDRGHARLLVPAVAVLDPVRAGHLRDQQQGQRGAQLRDPGRQGRRRSGRAKPRRGRSPFRRAPTTTSATSRSMSTRAWSGSSPSPPDLSKRRGVGRMRLTPRARRRRYFGGRILPGLLKPP